MSLEGCGYKWNVAHASAWRSLDLAVSLLQTTCALSTQLIGRMRMDVLVMSQKPERNQHNCGRKSRLNTCDMSVLKMS